MKKILSVVVAAALLNAGAAFAEMKIAVVDLNKVITSDPHMAVAQSQLKKKFEPRNQELSNSQKTFQASVDKYNQEQSAGKLKGADLKNAQQKLFNENKKIQEMRDTFQRDLVNAQNQSMQTILKRVESIVAKIAADKKYDLVVTKMSVVYSKPEFDITEQVVGEVKKK